ncbi:MAG TPA: selenium-binding protein SBP56-related protein [Gemmatimonadaceae bacterium]|nr:selenium-binding protein SBP56-related protein [Gemmatimonadaceae bacterium]
MRLALCVVLFAATACRTPAPPAASTPSRFLYVWAGDDDQKDSDFLAVIDVRDESPTFGQVLTTTPVGMTATLPHHLEYALPDSTQLLFANGHHHEAIFLFNTSDAEHPRLVRQLPPVAPFRFPHDMVRLPNGNVLVGFLRSNGASPLPGDSTNPGGHGGIAELDTAGALIRSASAADSTFQVPIRPYSFAMLPAIDRILMTSAPMMEDTSADVVQMWRMSDLTLLGTTQVPNATAADGTVLPSGRAMPFEPRVMPDGSILFNAYGCGLYRVTALDQPHPVIVNVLTFPVPAGQLGSCGIPLVVGHYWLMAVGAMHAVIALDIQDPAHPVEVARLQADSVFRPHWLAKDSGSDRIVVGAENGGEQRMLLAHVDSATGKLRWDDRLKLPDGTLGISFLRAEWPHGRTGNAFGHAALFRR